MFTIANRMNIIFGPYMSIIKMVIKVSVSYTFTGCQALDINASLESWIDYLKKMVADCLEDIDAS